MPLEYGDAATGGASEDQEEPDDVPNDAATGEAAEDQEEPDDVPDDDDLRRVIVDARTQCESQKEKLKFDHMLEDHKKGLYPNCEDGNTKLGSCSGRHRMVYLTKDLRSYSKY